MKEPLPSQLIKSEILISVNFTFDSAHFLNNYPGICANMHGHTYKLEVTIKGKADENGFVMDYLDMDRIVRENVLLPLDHKCINDVLDFNPTCEFMILWIWNKLEEKFKEYNCKLNKIILWESPNYSATLTADMIGN